MSDTNEKPDMQRFTSVTFEDVQQFLIEKGKNHNCPFCNTVDWVTAYNPEYPLNLIALSNDGSLSIPPPSLPLVPLVCKNCGYLRQHALGAIVSWKNGESL